MKQTMTTPSKRVYVLDTNVLMHDPAALFKFDEHQVLLPMQVIEELDNAKKGSSEVSRNARQASRFLDELTKNADASQIYRGIALVHPQGLRIHAQEKIGTLLFQTKLPETHSGFTQAAPDNHILAAVADIAQQSPDCQVILVSKDINLRIKAAISGLVAQDYESDRALDDFNLLYTGVTELPLTFWDRHAQDLRSWNGHGSTHYSLRLAQDECFFPNQFLYLPGDNGLELRVLSIDQESTATLSLTHDYRREQHAIWGIAARNREQNFALNALMDPAIDCVTILGTAGTGKTLLALAAGLAQTMDHHRYREIIMTRATVSVGEDIGFLPGTEEEKMTPWMGALTDNLEVLTQSQEGGAWGRAATHDVLSSRVKIRAMNFMRGRTFLSRYLIIDEAQNLTPKQMKTLLTRAGPGTKIVCLGNVEQIDTPYLTETTSGLTYVIDRFKHWMHSAHITLRRGERSRLADYASDVL